MKEFYNIVDFINYWIENPTSNLIFNQFYTKNNILYFNNIASLPIARIDNDLIFIQLNIIHKKIIKKILPIIINSRKEFFLVKNFLVMQFNKDDFSIRYEDLDNMLSTYIIKEFYDILNVIKFDMIKHIFNYIDKYDCYDAWNQINEFRIKKLVKANYYHGVHPEILNVISKIDLNFKIYSFLK